MTLSIKQNDKELEILQHICHRESIRQRDLAEIVGMSLGMTNAIMKRLVTKGLLTVRKVNNRNMIYAVSPEGMEEIARRSYKYFKRTIKNIVYYKNSIEELVRDVRDSGFSGIVLVGKSDVDFIVEHLCGRHGLRFVHRRDAVSDAEGGAGDEAAGGFFLLYAEGRPAPKRENPEGSGRGNLRDVLIQV